MVRRREWSGVNSLSSWALCPPVKLNCHWWSDNILALSSYCRRHAALQSFLRLTERLAVVQEITIPNCAHRTKWKRKFYIRRRLASIFQSNKQNNNHTGRETVLTARHNKLVDHLSKFSASKWEMNPLFSTCNCCVWRERHINVYGSWRSVKIRAWIRDWRLL